MSLLQIYQWVCQWKNFENRLTFGEVMGKSLVSCFFETQCSYIAISSRNWVRKLPAWFFYPLDASQCRSKLFSSSSMPSNQVFINVPSVWFLLIYSLYSIWLSFHHIYISSQWTIPNNQQTGSNPNNFISFTLLFWQQKHLYINLSSLPGDAMHLQY